MAKAKEDKPPTQVEVFFDSRDGAYWYKLHGRYVALKRTDLYMHLRAIGLRDDLFFDGQREIDWPLWRAQMERMVDYAGSLAGHRVGLFSDGSGRKSLVTDEACGVWEKPAKGEPKFFKAFILELLPEGQHEYFLTWLALGLQSLRRGDFQPGQTVILAGPAQCGKSLLQNIITEILGGRSANPFRYMMELTQFNKDLIGSEHWQIEDPATTTDIRTRRQFGAKLKEATVNRDMSVHAKGKDALLNLPLSRRVSISVNDESENLAIVPPLDPSIEDKVFLFHCARAEKCFDPFRTKGGEFNREKVWATILEEVPLIRAWLLAEFVRVPKHLRDDRFGVKAWHHPTLKAELIALAPETRLLQLIDDGHFTGDGPHTTLKAKSSEIEKLLRKSEVAFEAEKVLRFIGACGSHLGRLVKSQPQRVSKHIKDGYALWEIKPPSSTTES